MQNLQEQHIHLFGDFSLQQAVLKNLCQGNEQGILNLAGWKIKAITHPENTPSVHHERVAIYCFSQEVPAADFLLKEPCDNGVKTFLITREVLSPTETRQAESLGIACFTLDNSQNILAALQDYLFEQFTIIPEGNTPRKKVSSIPKLTGDLLKYAAKIAIDNWANNSLRNLRSQARERLASLADATDDNCHALLTQVLLGKGDCGIGSLKFFLMKALGMTTAKNSEESKRNISRAINHLEHCLRHDLQHIKVNVMNKNQEKIVCFLDKKQITKENVSKAYEAYLQLKPKVLITDENYRMQFRALIEHESTFADYMIASVFKISRPNAREIRKKLHEELGLQNIADPSSELRVLRPEFWQAVCTELDAVCPKHHQELWVKVKSDMATVFNDRDAQWLYFPKNRVLAALQIICDDLRASAVAVNIEKTEYLLTVLERKSIKLDSISLDTLSNNKRSIITLYEKACMNGLLDFARQLQNFIGTTIPNFDENLYIAGKNSISPEGTHEALRFFLDLNALNNVRWQSFCEEVIIIKNSKALQVLLADNKLDPIYHSVYMELAYNSRSFDMVRLLCPLQQSWSTLTEKLVTSTVRLRATELSLLFIMLTASSLSAPLFFKDDRFSDALKDTSIKDSVVVLGKMVDKAKVSSSLLQKHTLFASVSPLPKELTDTIMNNLVNAHSSLDMPDEEIKSLVRS